MSRALLVVLALGATACTQVTRIEGGEEECVPTAVQAAFDRTCARGGCHDAAGAAAGLVLSAPTSAEVLQRTASQKPMPLVTLGDPQASYLAQKLLLDPATPIVGSAMPVGFDVNDPMQVEDVALILGWIGGAALPGCEVEGTTGTTGGDTTGGETTDTPVGDLPCDIEMILATRCRSCHSDPPIGAPMPLVTRDDLLAPTPTDATKTVAELSAERMADGTMPPPPGMPVPTAEREAFEAWLAAGTPAGMCGPDPEPGPFDVEPMCSSGRFWGEGDDGDPRMHPGRDCITCHDRERPDEDDIPDLLIGGTVYPTGHEPNDCYGDSSADLQVVVRSLMSDDEITLQPNATGNFLLRRGDAPAGFAAPFSVKLVQGDLERIMPIEAPHGSCNRCHTQDGTMNAPGRVVSP